MTSFFSVFRHLPKKVLMLGFDGLVRDSEAEYLPQLGIAELGFSLHVYFPFLMSKEHLDGNADQHEELGSGDAQKQLHVRLHSRHTSYQ